MNHSSSHTANLNQNLTMLSEATGISLWLTYVVEYDLQLVVLGWLLVMVTAIANHLSKKPTTKEAAFKSLGLLFIKFIAYTIACIAFKLFTVWLIKDGVDFLGYPSGVVTIAVFFFMWNWEFQGIGNNIEEKGNPKPSIFIFMTSIGKGIMGALTKLSNKACGITPTEEDKDTP